MLRVSLGLIAALALQAAAPGAPGAPTGAGWPQWGGPSRDFRAAVGRLAESWPAEGPPTLWSRPLGEGQSGILVDGGQLYTMYRSGDDEVVVSLDAATGDTVWEHRYRQQPHEQHIRQHGVGPRSTPLIAGDRLFTIGISGKLLGLDKADGSVLWQRELWGPELGGHPQGSGYSSSPLAHAGMVIVPVGADDAGLVAFDQADGKIVWKSAGLRNSYSSPSILDLAGRPQLVSFMAEELIGLDPATGTLLWRYPHVNQWRHNINVPLAAGDLLFLSSPQAGARGLKLVPNGDSFDVEVVWSSRRIQLYHVTSVRNGHWVYGSTGVTSPAFMIAVDIRTGEVAWRERGFAKANCVAAGDRLVVLDEDGWLYLVAATPQELVVQSRARLLERTAWTAPTIVGTTLYARDDHRVVAVDLG